MALPAFAIPLVAKGLDLVANAAMAKGKQWFEKETGINLDEQNLSEEAVLQLKQYELDHEEDLIKLRQEDDRLAKSIEMAYLQDVADARAMQQASLQQEDKIAKRFVYYFAIFWTAFAVIYITAITFMNIPEENVRFADTILGFLLGTIVAQIIAYFYGSSQGSKNKDSIKDELIKRAKT